MITDLEGQSCFGKEVYYMPLYTPHALPNCKALNYIWGLGGRILSLKFSTYSAKLEHAPRSGPNESKISIKRTSIVIPDILTTIISHV